MQAYAEVAILVKDSELMDNRAKEEQWLDEVVKEESPPRSCWTDILVCDDGSLVVVNESCL